MYWPVFSHFMGQQGKLLRRANLRCVLNYAFYVKGSKFFSERDCSCIHKAGSPLCWQQIMESHWLRCQGGLRCHLSMRPGQATWLLCASVKPAAKVYSKQQGELKNRCHMWVELSWMNYITPSHCHLPKQQSSKSSFLPLSVFELYTAESPLPLSHS